MISLPAWTYMHPAIFKKVSNPVRYLWVILNYSSMNYFVHTNNNWTTVSLNKQHPPPLRKYWKSPCQWTQSAVSYCTMRYITLFPIVPSVQSCPLFSEIAWLLLCWMSLFLWPAGWHFWFGVRCLNNYGRDCHENLVQAFTFLTRCILITLLIPWLFL